MGKLPWVDQIVVAAKEVLKFIGNHHHTLALFRQHGELELLRPGDTRFATVFLMLERMAKASVKKALVDTVTDEEYNKWLDKQTANTHRRGEEVKQNILSGEFWKNVDMLCGILEPIVVVLRLTDSDKPTTGDVYYLMYNVQEKLEKLTIPVLKKKEVLDLYMKRWNGTIHHHVHGAGFLLNPKFHEKRGCAWVDEQNKQMELDFQEECLMGLTSAVERFYHDAPKKKAQALKQYSSYKQAEKGMLNTKSVWEAAVNTPAHEWWETWCRAMPELQHFACKILAQVQCASACERNWSSYGFVHSVRRNKLGTQKAADLVYVFTNMRLRDRVTSLATEPDTEKPVDVPMVHEWLESLAQEDSEAE
jgi:hypothetical protein